VPDDRQPEPPAAATVRAAPVRAMWLVAGLVAVGLGGVGIVVPGLPTTVFFIIAASCFTRSSPRLERWVLDLPRVGPMVRDYRAGLGMRRRAKVMAIASMSVVGVLSVLLAPGLVIRAVILVAVLVGIAWVAWRVPTRPDQLP
jgi:uncharacterized membrane protein YbaN (DUF454 family)